MASSPTAGTAGASVRVPPAAVPGVGLPPTASTWHSGAWSSFRTLWAELSPALRLAIVAIAASAVLVFAVALVAESGIRNQLIAARGQQLEGAVAIVEPQLPELGGGARLTPSELRRIDTALSPLLGGGHVGINVWALDGTLLYQAGEPATGYEADLQARLQQAMDAGVVSLGGSPAVPELRHADGGRLVTHYVALRDPQTDAVVGVLESHEQIEHMLATLTRTSLAVHGAITIGLTLVVLSIFLVLRSAIRWSGRQRAIAHERARQFAVLSATAEAVATTFDPDRLFATLEQRVMTGLGLDRLRLVPAEHATAEPAAAVKLRDGRAIVAERAAPLSEEEQRILRAAAHSLDAALMNTALLDATRQAAEERRHLLRTVAVAHEEERRRLVGELHDSLASELIRTLYAVRRVRLTGADASADVHAGLETIEGMVEGAERSLRAFLARIRPPALDVSDPVEATREVIRRFRSETGIRTRLHVSGEPARLRVASQVVLVRGLEEALLNVDKHAEATMVAVRLVERGAVVLSVADNGRGWPETFVSSGGRGLGLEYLRERVEGVGGTLRFTQSRMRGARLEICLPAGGSAS